MVVVNASAVVKMMLASNIVAAFCGKNNHGHIQLKFSE